MCRVVTPKIATKTIKKIITCCYSGLCDFECPGIFVPKDRGLDAVADAQEGTPSPVPRSQPKAFYCPRESQSSRAPASLPAPVGVRLSTAVLRDLCALGLAHEDYSLFANLGHCCSLVLKPSDSVRWERGTETKTRSGAGARGVKEGEGREAG